MKNGFEKLGRSICMESPPSGTPTCVFLRACAINNREWARGSNPAWAHPYDRRQMLENQHIATFTLCKSETLRVYAHVRSCGNSGKRMGGCATPPSTPISERNCHLHTDSLLRPPVVPKCVRSRLLCAHYVCVVVPERQRVAYARPVARRVWRCICASRHITCACPSADMGAHNARPSPTQMRPSMPTCLCMRAHCTHITLVCVCP